MARQRPADTPYFSARLKNRLREALTMRSMLIEAPSGYGKTTAVQNYIHPHLPRDTAWVRHVGAEESPQAAWRRFCQAVRKIDEPTGRTLLGLGLPDEDNAGDVAALLREMDSAQPAWLVLDDFQHIAPLAPMAVWKALLEHDSPMVRVAVVTRALEPCIMPYEKSGYLRLDVADLRLTEGETREYAAHAGITLAEEEAAELHRRAEGWMIALALHLRRWRETGGLAAASGLEGLLRDVIWNGLDDAGRDFLLRLSPFECFSHRQASFLLDRDHLPRKAMVALQRNALLRFDAAQGLYYPHSTLLEFTRKVFAQLPDARQREALYAAGGWCAAEGDWEAAISFYYRLRDFERILSLDLSGMEGNRLLDMPGMAYTTALTDIAANCTRGMKLRHPVSAIQLAFELLSQGCYEEFGALFAEMGELVETAPMPPDRRDYLRGELLLVEAFSRYNDIAEMGLRMQRASELTGGRTALVALDNSWTFGNVSVLFMYHSETDRLDGECADMKTYCPYYFAMTQGHGSGAPELMEAECLLHRGDAAMAQVHACKARHEAALRGQASILIGAEFVLGRAAVLRGDTDALVDAMDAMTGIADAHPQKTNRMAADMARSYLMGLLDRPQDMAEWLREGTPGAFAKRLFTPAVPFADLCRARYLLLTDKPEILLGEHDAAMGLAAALRYPLALLHGHVHSAAAWMLRGERSMAANALQQALDMALPDGLLLPLVENHASIAPLLEDLAPSMAPGFATSVRALAQRMEEGRKVIADRLYSPRGVFGLSRREYETASLAAQGLSNTEIAGQLFLSPNTVKTHLKTAYRKTGATSRTALRQMLRQTLPRMLPRTPQQ